MVRVNAIFSLILIPNPFQDLVKNNRINRKPSESVEENEDDDGDMEVEEVDSDEWDEEGEGEPGMHRWIH